MAEPAFAASRRALIDPLGATLAAIVAIAFLFQPLMLLRPNRIAPAQGAFAWEALPGLQPMACGIITALVVLILISRADARLRLAAAVAGLVGLGLAVGSGASHLLPPGSAYARVAPGAGAWLALFALSLATGDALVRLRLSPSGRIAALVVAAGVLAGFLASGLWSDLSVLREYASRSDAFLRELWVHAGLSVFSLLAAVVVGVPLAMLLRRVATLRRAALAALNVLQTIPSMALFGLLIAPLAWIGAHVPGAAALGIAGIGVAPAFIALFAYSLLPIVGSTIAGFEAVSERTREAADAMGMTAWQKLLRVELPLALPVILTGVRIVLVQNIGLSVIAGLVGGGGLGVFVFQGISQTATDLVLLGALPTVAMAFAAGIVFDALIDLSRRQETR
ncbi:ABC transporter permease [Rhizobium rhizosphaerae]|uniref:ABC transporter permease n=1 Tax=Xaviernesmea rhizosphaerae TaxID=1672749 RepID=A0A1Q9AGB2_9HYPH|nr:ABC transporter permease [Xaviernesmea rhizosphaerae]OLP53966.1 ABC transporter permease [Xaviernesmea rhizosphaerae]